PSRASTPPSCATARGSWCATWGRSTAPTWARSGWTRPGCSPGRTCRSGSTGSPTTSSTGRTDLMPASASRRPSSSAASRLSIGQVLEILRDEFPDLAHSKLHYLECDEFPDLAHSKLHYLESEGLISPERTPAGYRKYSREDVDRLRFVLRAQRDRYWPLKVIKEHLLEHGVDSEVTSIASRPGPSSTLQAVRLDRRGL